MRFLLFSIFIASLTSAQEIQKIALLPGAAETRIKIPFSGIQVIDARFDRTNVGAIQDKLEKQTTTVHRKIEISFPDSFHIHFPLILQTFLSFDSASDEKLVILVKRFRVVDWIRPKQSDPELVLNISGSFFSLKGDEYIKSGSVDETISEQMYVARKKQVDTTRPTSLRTLLMNIFENQSWKKTGLTFSKNQIESGINKRFEFPVFTDSVKHPGIYRTFSDFLNNTPSVMSVRVMNQDNEFTQLKDNKGEIIEPENVWGASDGKDAFIVFRNRFYKLHPKDRSFIIQSFRSAEDQKPGRDHVRTAFDSYGLAGLAIRDAKETKKEIFYLNMENGTIHLEEIFGTSTLQLYQKDILKKH